MIDLATRSGDGLEITLYWDKELDNFFVRVSDARTDERFEVPCQPEEAWTVFEHVMAYRDRAKEYVPCIGDPAARQWS